VTKGREATSEWVEIELGEVLDVTHGFAFKGEYFTVGGHTRLVTPGNFYEAGGFRDRYESQKSYEGPIIEEYVLPPDALVIAMTEQAPGLLGSAALVPSDGNRWLHNQRIGRVRSLPERACARYLYYLFNSPAVRSQISASATGTKVRHTAPNRVKAVRVAMPPLEAQRRIAAVLASLDELIEINERRIEVLEDLARSLYREWFVRFRFPAYEDVQFVDSELGRIPHAWRVQRLDEIADLNRVNVKPSASPEAAFQHYSIPAFDDTRLPAIEIGSTIKSGKYRVAGEAVLLSKLNPRIPRVWSVEPDDSPDAIASTEFLVWTGTTVPNGWLWACFEGELFRSVLAGLAGGTSTSHQRAKPEDIRSLPILVAPRPLLDQYDALARPSLQLANQLRRQNRALARTREVLLPRLVTGCLDISDIDLGDLLPAEVA
jgi:type I restriction enzyme S subunit